MRVVNRAAGLLVVAVGLFLAGWGPVAFELLSGGTLPAPAVNDRTAMAIWSGVAFARVFGALLVSVGLIVWAANARTPRDGVFKAIVCAGALFAALITSSQQIAIWTNSVGWVLVALFCLIAAVSGFGWRSSRMTPAM
jgi:hypothetical protein